jgi:beta-lactamase class A
MSNRVKIFLSAIGLLLVGFGSGVGVFRIFFCHQETFETHQIRRQGEYKFINPLYECEVGDKEYLKKYIPFENMMKNRIEKEVAGSDIQLAYYFRNLNNGPSFGFNSTINYAPASLLKVPIMIAYFKKAEYNPEILDQRLIFIHNSGDNLTAMQQIQSGPSLTNGEKYSVQELIEQMIIYSDNEAMALLTANLTQEELLRTYSELGVSNPYGQEQDNVLTVKDYASFFRILYNAAYLNKDYSEKALNLLSQCSFKGGIPAGIPNGIAVAHKFGERELKDGDYRQQFHDCGIIYYQKYPYLLCVMSRGNDRDKLIETIKNISRITFEEISRSYPQD